MALNILSSSRDLGIYRNNDIITIAKDLSSLELHLDIPVGALYEPGTNGSDALPTGLTWNSGTSKISGDPTAVTNGLRDVVIATPTFGSNIQVNGDFSSLTDPVPGFTQILRFSPWTVIPLPNTPDPLGVNLAVIRDASNHLYIDTVLSPGQTYRISFEITSLTPGRQVFFYLTSGSTPHILIEAFTTEGVHTIDYIGERVSFYTDASDFSGQEAFIKFLEIIPTDYEVAETYQLEVVEPTFTQTAIECTKQIRFTDTTVTNNPALEGRGTITYYVEVDDEWVTLGSVSRGGSLLYNFECYDPGTFNVKSVLTVRSIPNCGGTSPIIFQAEYETTITISNYKPELNLSVLYDSTAQLSSCCGAIIGSEVTVTPDFLLNNTLGLSCAESTLTYKLYDFAGNLIDELAYQIDNATPEAPEDLVFTFTPTANEDYKVIATLENCCSSVETTTIISACYYVSISKDCHTVSFTNSSFTKEPTVTIYEQDNTTVAVASQVIPAGETISVSLPQDGIYIARVVDTEETTNHILIDYCDMLSCLTSVYQLVLCNEDNDSCLEDKSRDLINRLSALVKLYFSYLQGEYGFNNMYTAIDSAKIQYLQDMQNVMLKIKKYCKLVGNCGDDVKAPGKRGCGCS